MDQSASLLSPPTHEPAVEPADGGRVDSLLLQHLENLDLAERVERALSATGYGPLRDLAVTVHAGLVVLGGRAPSYYLKQVAQTTALSVPGVERVLNELEVCRPA